MLNLLHFTRSSDTNARSPPTLSGNVVNALHKLSFNVCSDVIRPSAAGRAVNAVHFCMDQDCT
jgi:hypothetical protein